MMSTSQHPDNTGNVEGALEAMALHDDRAPVSESNFDSKNNAEPHHVGAYVPPARLRSDTNNPSSYPYQPEDASHSQSSYYQQSNYSTGGRGKYPGSHYSRNHQGGYNYNTPSSNENGGLPPPLPSSSHFQQNQDYPYSNVPQSHQYSGNPSYGMNRQPTSNPRYQGNHRSYSNTNSFYNDNQNYRHHPSGGNHWVPNQNPGSSSFEQNKPWQPMNTNNYGPSTSFSHYDPNKRNFNPRADNLYSSYRSRGCVGHWHPTDGHIVAARNESMEKSLFESVHVSTGINFNKYDDIPIEATGDNVPQMVSSFKEANLDPLLCENIELARYETPTPVQKYSLPIVEAGRDLMACAQTGSGKTAGFLFPILNELFIRGPPKDLIGFHSANAYQRRPIRPMGLILAPTRELTSQIYEEAKRFAYRSWVRPVVAYGGVPIMEQWNELKYGCALLVATPGRLSDLISRGMISLHHVRYLVLDEADRMLDMGFEPQIRRIVEEEDMPPNDQRVTLMFSATFPKEIQYLARDFLSDYIFLSVGRVGAASDNVHQSLIEVNEEEKQDVLLDILHSNPAGPENLVLVFVETKKMCDIVAHFLRKNGFQAAAIHGDRDQREREEALDLFRNAVKPILVATAVAARGLDIPNVTYVLNYDLPNDIDDYVHRIGRTGRAGNPGKSITFFNYDKNKNVIKDLYQIFKDANQVIPPFLAQYYDDAMAPYRNHMAKRGSGSKRGRGSAHRDFRRDAEYNSYQPSMANRGQYYNNTSTSNYYPNSNSSNSAARSDWGSWDGQ